MVILGYQQVLGGYDNAHQIIIALAIDQTRRLLTDNDIFLMKNRGKLTCKHLNTYI